MIRKSVNCLVTLSLMFFVFLFVYACSSDADYSAKIEDIDRNQYKYLQPIVTQYLVCNKSEIWP